MALNWTGAGTGALTGAGVGSKLGPWGTLAGAALGGTIGLFSEGATNDKLKKFQTGTNEQEGLHNNILSQAMNMANGGGYERANQYYNNLLGDNQQEAFNQFSAPYLQQFQEQMLPEIAERFAKRGALSSSGFGQALGGAASGLQSNLAKLFSDLQSQAANQQYGQYNQLAQTGLNYEPFGYTRNKGSQGSLGPFAQGLSDNMEGILSGIMSLFKKPASTGSTEGIK